jgi:hypothetical protein
MIRHPALAGTRNVSFILFILLCGGLVFPHPVHAGISYCSYSSDIVVFPAGEQSTATFTITNDDTENRVQWVSISRPSEQYVFNQVESSWTITPAEYDSSTTTIQATAGDIGPGFSISIAITLTAGSATGDEPWTVLTSDATDGSSSAVCTGLSTSIYGSTPTPTTGVTATPTPTTVPGTTATSTPTTAPGTTATPTPTSTPIVDTIAPIVLVNRLPLILYNKPPVVAGTASDDQAVTEISYSLTNGKIWTAVGITKGKIVSYSFTPTISADGLYSLRIRGRDARGNSVVSDAITFTVDATPPTLTVDTDFSQSFKLSPSLIGSAQDGSGIASIEGSLDGGVNWLQAKVFEKNPNIRVPFAIVLPSLDDGNYTVRVRATDGGGNVSTSKETTMIIDRLPPRIGSGVLLLGPHVLEPSSIGGSYELSEHVNVKLVVQAVGGPTEMVLTALSQLTNQQTVFQFQKNPDTGLWVASVDVPDHGLYTMSIHAIDGAGNTGDATIGVWDVKDPGFVKTGNQTPITGATVRVFVYDTETKTFLLWDGESFGGVNPQLTDADGSYHVLLPPGSYYLTVEKNGYRRIRSSIITVTKPTTISSGIIMSTGLSFSIGPFTIVVPSFLSPFEEVKISDSVSTINTPASPSGKLQSAITKKIPQAILDERNKAGQPMPMHVVFIPLFHPLLSAQLQVLEEMLRIDPYWQILVVLTQGSPAEAGVLKRQGKYALSIIADPDGEMTKALGVWSTPVHYFIGSDGAISGQITGLLLDNEIVDNRNIVTHSTKSIQE